MSDFCDFVPDDPSCQTQEPVVDPPSPDPVVDPSGGDDGGMDDGHGDKDGHDMMDMDKMGRMRMDGKMSWEEVDEWLDLWLFQETGWRTAIMTSVSLAAWSFLELFRYSVRTPDMYTSSAQVAGSGTDYYKMYHQYYGYAYAGIFSALSISHILAWMGIGVNFDYFFDMSLAFFFIPLIQFAGSILVALAYDNAYTVSQDTTSSYQSTALSLMTTIQNEMTGLMAVEVGRKFEEQQNQDNWIFAHYSALDDDTKDWWRENEMFQRWVSELGLNIFHLIEEQREMKEYMDDHDKVMDKTEMMKTFLFSI